jgi:endoglucanase
MNAPRLRAVRTTTLAAAVLTLGACGGGGVGSGRVSAAIRVDQVGYAPAADKLAVVVGGRATTFQVVDERTGRAVDPGDRPLGAPQDSALSGETVQVAEFSDLRTPGTYHLEAPGADPSPSFSIATDVYRAPALATLKAFYYWRASTALEPAQAGPWARAAGHPNTGLQFWAGSFTSDAPKHTTATTWDAPGGWYDAGDYGEYVVNGGITVGTLLALHELHPAAAGDATGIPESGNGTSDLLDEVRWELDWMLAMQDDDGGVFFKLAGATWPGWIMPAADTQPRYVIGKSTGSTLNFAAVLAQAGRVYAPVDATFAARCTAAAESAYGWALVHPSADAPTAPELGSGPYAEGDYSDEFAWAAAELYVTTGDTAYRDDPQLQAVLASPAVARPAWWADVKALAYYSLATWTTGLPEETVAAVKAAVRAGADALLAATQSGGYHYPLSGFEWGSAGTLGNAGVLLIYAARFAEASGDVAGAATYRNAAVQVADYLLGRNTVDTSFVTGFGSRSPQHLHHRPSQADGVTAPIPGLVAGGPNSGLQDLIAGAPGVSYPTGCTGATPAWCYTDQLESYSSNEPAINQNASVFFLLAALDAEL